jgi:selenocysteine lyase/cysteine desulfurase
MNNNDLTEKNLFRGLSRRDFVKYGLSASALSIGALSKLNAGIYQSLKTLDQKYIQDESPDGVYWNAIRRHFMFQDGVIMMNNGTVGPMPKPVFNTLMKVYKVQATNPFDVYNYQPQEKERVRKKVAQFINAEPEEVVITRNTTEGINFVVNGMELKEGDEILLSTMEHPGGRNPWHMKAKRYGVKINWVPLGLPPASVDEFVAGFEKALTPKTKVISISHTVYISGLISPIKELCKMAHEKGLLVLADSAHGIGMLDLNMKEMDIDFFSTSPYKWLGAPTGVGVLFIKKELQKDLWPTIASGGWDTYEDARKFETCGQRAEAPIVALGEAVDFQNYIGKQRIERRIKALAGYFKQELKKIPGARLHTSEDPYISGGLTAFSVEGLEPKKIVEYVRGKYNIVVRTTGRKEEETYGVRVSTHYYITFKQVDMLLEGIRHLASHKA